MPEEASDGITKTSTLEVENSINQALDKLSIIAMEDWMSACNHVTETEDLHKE
jgi:hypothetical protein